MSIHPIHLALALITPLAPGMAILLAMTVGVPWSMLLPHITLDTTPRPRMMQLPAPA